MFRTYYGPMLKAFAALDAGKPGRRWHDDLLALIGRLNRADDGTGRAERVPRNRHHPALSSSADGRRTINRSCGGRAPPERIVKTMIDDARGRIDYEETGAGQTVVLVPGSCSTGSAWRPS